MNAGPPSALLWRVRDRRWDFLYDREKQPVREVIVEKFAEQLAEELGTVREVVVRSLREHELLSHNINEQFETALTLTDAVLTGIAQGLAVLPGLSRPGSTLATLLVLPTLYSWLERTKTEPEL